MSDVNSEDRRLDDELAEITDQILNQEPSETIPPSANMLPPAEEEEFLRQGELARLRKVVVQLKQAGLSENPDREFSARLHTALQEEWRRSGPKPAVGVDKSLGQSPETRVSLFQQIKTTLGQLFSANPGRSLVFAGAALALIILLVLLPVGEPLVGAAGTEPALQPLEYALGLVCLALLIWLLLKKRD